LTDEACSSDAFLFLNSCYKFVCCRLASCQAQGHASFEAALRDWTVLNLPSRGLSRSRGRWDSERLTTASGILHEIDIFAAHDQVTGMVELNQRQDDVVDKNDVILFFAKLLDYLCAHPFLSTQGTRACIHDEPLIRHARLRSLPPPRYPSHRSRHSATAPLATTRPRWSSDLPAHSHATP
jgi:hypothetical protein